MVAHELIEIVAGLASVVALFVAVGMAFRWARRRGRLNPLEFLEDFSSDQLEQLLRGGVLTAAEIHRIQSIQQRRAQTTPVRGAFEVFSPATDKPDPAAGPPPQ